MTSKRELADPFKNSRSQNRDPQNSSLFPAFGNVPKEMDDLCSQMQSLLSGSAHGTTWDVDEAELERELLALEGQNSEDLIKNVQRRKTPDSNDHIVIDPQKLVNEHLKQDDDISDVDENDEDLLAELNALEGVKGVECEHDIKVEVDETNLKVIRDRLDVYKKAISECTTDQMRLKRLGRQLNAIEHLEKQVLSGHQVDLNSLPPLPSVCAVRPVEETKKIEEPKGNSSLLLSKLSESYASFQKQLASCGEDRCKQRRLQRVLKQYEQAIEAFKNNKPFNYGSLPEAIGVGPLPIAPKQTKPSSTLSSPPSTQAALKSLRPLGPAKKSASFIVPSITQTSPNTSIEKLKSLAIDAKRRGQMDEAKKYMVELKRSTSLRTEDGASVLANSSTLIQGIQSQLEQQLKLASLSTNDPRMLEDAKRELAKFKSAKMCSLDDKIRFHYEDREIANDADVHINSLIIKIAVNADAIGKMIRVTYPFPKDKPQVIRQKIMDDSDFELTFSIDRGDYRPSRRSSRRKDILFELISRYGFLNLSERIDASASLALSNLENSAQYRCSALSMLLRRKTVTTIDVSLRLRYPLCVQSTQLHRWLVLDTPHIVVRPSSLQLINYASAQLERSLQMVQDPNRRIDFQREMKTLSLKRDKIVARLKTGGQQALKEHLDGLEQLLREFETDQVKANEDEEALRQSTIKIKLVGKEMETLRRGLQ